MSPAKSAMLNPRTTWNAPTVPATLPRWSAGRPAIISVTILVSSALSSSTVNTVPSALTAMLARTAWYAESTAFGRSTGPSDGESGGGGGMLTASCFLHEADEGGVECFVVAGPREDRGVVA